MKTINLTLIIFIFIINFINAQTVIENRWNFPDIGDNSDWLNDIAIDDSGYTYFCATLEGSSWIIVGSLTPDLMVNWIKPIYFGNNVGTAVGLALDDSSLYVATNSGTFNNRNAVIYKCDKYTGQSIHNVYSNPRNTGDFITDIKLDKYSNVIIAGTSYFNADTSESFIFKYDKNLNYLWGQTYLAPIVMDREFNHLAVDDSGNVYVAGKVIIKLSPDGEVRWNNTYGADFITANKTGQAITAVRQNSQWMIDKYGQNGDVLWGIGYDDGASMGAITKLIIDDLDNIYLCGSKGWPNESWHTVKISTSGVVQWQVDEIGFVGNAYVYDLAVDKKRNVYVTGALYAWSEELLSAKTVKYDPLGNKVWQQFYGSNDNRDRYGGCISVNDSLTVVVGGLISDTENRYSGDLIVWQYQQRERFKAIPDGWRHENDDPPMWPEAYWSQFDYSKFPYPSSWVNFPMNAKSSDFPDWPNFVRAFGEKQCYLNSVFPIVYNPVAVKYWRNLVEPWEGSCHGFSLSSLMFFNNKLKINDHFPGFEKTYDLPLWDEALNMIHSYQLYQYGTEQQLAFGDKGSRPLSETFPEIETMLLRRRQNNKVLSIYNNSGSGGHVVVACSLITVDANLFELYIYDCNYPGSEEIINIDTSLGRWYYNRMPDWGGPKGIALDIDIDSASTQPLLPINNSGFEGAMVFSARHASITIENSGRRKLGYNTHDRQIIDSIDNAAPIIPLTGTESPPIGYMLPDDEYKITTQDLQDSVYTITLFSDSTLFSVSRENCLNGETDLFSMNKGLRGIRYQNLDNVNKIVEIEGTTNLPGQAMTCSVGKINISKNDSIEVNKVGNNGFIINNYGPNKIYNLRLEYAFEPGYRIFEHSGLLLDSASTHLIIPDWEFMDEKSLPIFIDRDGDGSSDDTLEVNNEFVSGINDKYEGLVPSGFVLDQNYPNPFNSMTTIRFGIPEQSHLRITVYNLLGQEVDVIADEIFEAGYSRVFWDASKFSSGIYLCRIQASGTHNTGNKYDKTIKMLLVK